MQFHPPVIVPTFVPFEDTALCRGWDAFLEPPDYPPVPPEAVCGRARTFALTVARTVGETLLGLRSAQQLTPWLSPDQCQRLIEWTRRLRGVQVRLARVHLVQLHQHRVEGFLIFDCGEQRISVTLRLDESGERWRCAQLAILLPGMSYSAAGARPQRSRIGIGRDSGA